MLCVSEGNCAHLAEAGMDVRCMGRGTLNRILGLLEECRRKGYAKSQRGCHPLLGLSSLPLGLVL